MPDLAAAVGRLARAVEQLQAEQDRDGRPRSAEVRRVADDLYTVAGDLTSAAYDLGGMTQRDR